MHLVPFRAQADPPHKSSSLPVKYLQTHLRFKAFTLRSGDGLPLLWFLVGAARRKGGRGSTAVLVAMVTVLLNNVDGAKLTHAELWISELGPHPKDACSARQWLEVGNGMELLGIGALSMAAGDPPSGGGGS